jgi:hypothetical protein
MIDHRSPSCGCIVVSMYCPSSSYCSTM